MRRRWLVRLGVTPVVALALLGCSDDGPTPTAVTVTTIAGPYDFDFTIPSGTGDLIDAGARPAVFPTFLDARVGQTIRLINNDSRGHTMGTFYVLANSSLTYRFTTAGRFIGECSVNPGEEFVLTVSE